jgi:hypothetical protein
MIRTTREFGPKQPEQLLLTSDEAGLCIRALTHYVHTTLVGFDNDEQLSAFNAIQTSTGDALEALEVTITFVEQYHTLTAKFAEVLFDPDVPAALTNADIEHVGSSLYRFGIFAVRQATDALAGNKLQFSNPVDAQGAADMVDQAAVGAYTLFKQFEPIALERGIEWMVWPAPGAELPITE